MKDLHEWESSLRERVEKINRRLIESVACDQEDLQKMSEYVIEAGGKRLRPILTLLSYSIASDKPYEEILDLAVATELVHTASLIHDDIIDNSDMRRGRETLGSKYGIYNAIVVGDYLFTKAYELASRYGPEVSRIMAQGAMKMAEGQILEYDNLGNLGMSEKTYLDIISRKTADLFSVCARGAAEAAGADKKTADDLGQFALSLGMAFQITDDILDIIGNEETLGKPIFVDIAHSAITLPVIHALSRNDSISESIRSILTDKGHLKDQREKLKNLFLESGSIEYSLQMAKDYVMQSIDSLKDTGKSPDLDTLMDLSIIVIDRISSIA